MELFSDKYIHLFVQIHIQKIFQRKINVAKKKGSSSIAHDKKNELKCNV